MDLPNVLFVGGFTIFFALLLKFSVPLKKKRMLRRCERVRDKMTDAEVKKFISFLRTHTMIKTPDVAWELVQTQHAINNSSDIDAQYKLLLYRTLMRRNVQGLQQINTIFVDKTGRRV
jgi:hypothetical protein